MPYQSKNRIANVFYFKDVINTKLSLHIVYKFLCSCCNTNYYDSKTFFMRTSENLGITHLTDKFVETPIKSAIFDHMFFDGHQASFDNYSLLLKESNVFKLSHDT